MWYGLAPKTLFASLFPRTCYLSGTNRSCRSSLGCLLQSDCACLSPVGSLQNLDLGQLVFNLTLLRVSADPNSCYLYCSSKWHLQVPQLHSALVMSWKSLFTQFLDLQNLISEQQILRCQDEIYRESGSSCHLHWDIFTWYFNTFSSIVITTTDILSEFFSSL